MSVIKLPSKELGQFSYKQGCLGVPTSYQTVGFICLVTKRLKMRAFQFEKKKCYEQNQVYFVSFVLLYSSINVSFCICTPISFLHLILAKRWRSNSISFLLRLFYLVVSFSYKIEENLLVLWAEILLFFLHFAIWLFPDCLFLNVFAPKAFVGSLIF